MRKQWYVVLDDGSTYSCVEGTKIICLTEDGNKVLDKSNDFDHIDDKHIDQLVDITFLLKKYLRKNKS